MSVMKSGAIVGLAIGAAACGQGNSDNVMAPEANALSPAEVDAALGPEVTQTAQANVAETETNAAGPSNETAE